MNSQSLNKAFPKNLSSLQFIKYINSNYGSDFMNCKSVIEYEFS